MLQRSDETGGLELEDYRGKNLQLAYRADHSALGNQSGYSSLEEFSQSFFLSSHLSPYG